MGRIQLLLVRPVLEETRLLDRNNDDMWFLHLILLSLPCRISLFFLLLSKLDLHILHHVKHPFPYLSSCVGWVDCRSSLLSKYLLITLDRYMCPLSRNHYVHHLIRSLKVSVAGTIKVNYTVGLPFDLPLVINMMDFKVNFFFRDASIMLTPSPLVSSCPP
jgi:hypothetical protein